LGFEGIDFNSVKGAYSMKFCTIGSHIINLAAISHVDSLKGSISVVFYGSETMRLRRPESDKLLAVLKEIEKSSAH
jgi:hypothetical protein